MTTFKKSKLRTVRVNIADLKEWPGNPRVHDLDLLAESLAANDQYRAIVVREKDMRILAGHGTVKAAKRLNWTEIDAHLIECNDQEAKRIVLMDNRGPERGGYDEGKLLTMLNSLPDLGGTGYEPVDLERLNAITTQQQEAAVPPDPPTPTFEFICSAPDQETRQDLIDDMERKGHKCRVL